MAVDEPLLQRLRRLSAGQTLVVLADYAERDLDFKPIKDLPTTHWHASIGNQKFEPLCMGPRFLDTRAGKGGGGAVDLAMHLRGLEFEQPVALLRTKGL